MSEAVNDNENYGIHFEVSFFSAAVGACILLKAGSESQADPGEYRRLLELELRKEFTHKGVALADWQPSESNHPDGTLGLIIFAPPSFTREEFSDEINRIFDQYRHAPSIHLTIINNQGRGLPNGVSSSPRVDTSSNYGSERDSEGETGNNDRASYRCFD
jgi:hypothetical protein